MATTRTSPRLLPRLAALVLCAAALALVACASPGEPQVEFIGVPTQPEPPPGVAVACMDALTSGTIVADPRWGVALAQDDGSRQQVIWPAGFAARQVDGLLELIDGTGRVVARAGDRVTIAGGMGQGNAWWACGGPAPLA